MRIHQKSRLTLAGRLTLSAALFAITATLLISHLPAQAPAANPAAAQAAAPQPKPEETEVWTPEPPVITPGAKNEEPPSDAIHLFDGKNIDEWVSAQDHAPAQWTVADGILTVKKAPGVGNI